MISPDPQRVRVLALLDTYSQALPGLMQSLSNIHAHVANILDRQGISRETWAAMSIKEREALIRRNRRR